jgi:hypothetical protein
MIADQPSHLHRLSGKGHRLTISSHNFREKLMRVRQVFAPSPVMHHEKPSAHSFFHRMHGIAGDGLLNL